MTTAAASATAHIVAEPAPEAPITLEAESRTCKKDVTASIIASLASPLECAQRSTGRPWAEIQFCGRR
ncbi:hypothetical protein [Microbacterium caowuchunii]|uniref:hypothetical protein n=1 Tax=Microbacterium caowuchunii TaxID=2614638 RepID=UPI001CD81791|nr:hypothetical protein [Microbacterium caowuchunii]